MATVRDTSTENKIDIVTTTENNVTITTTKNNVTVTQPSIQTVEILTGPIGPAGSSGSVYSNSTTVTYTSANILALDEVNVLSAPASGSYYEFKAIVEYNFVTTPYTVSLGKGGLLFTDAIIAGSTGTVPTDSSNQLLGYVEGINPIATALKFKVRNGPVTGGDGTITLKIQYNTATFG